MPSSYSSIFLHLIFSTKNREPLIKAEWKDRLYGYIGGILRQGHNTLIAAGGMEDHIHLLVLITREVAVKDLLRTIKTNSSRWVHDEIGAKFEWQRGYCAISVSPSATHSVERYIHNQEVHHKTKTYDREVIGILDACNIPYDLKYLFE
jgi:putative transposase